jgi:(1->4)-alpha-D-glucan 1-alpha-D-glucosylmutase
MPQEWGKHVNAWSRLLRARRGDIEGTAPPHRNDEYLFYQLLIGTWPVELTGDYEQLNHRALENYADRLKAAMIKSIREAKVESTWPSPNLPYENAVLAFVEAALHPEESRGFLAAFLPFQAQIARLGVRNSLVQTTLKLTVPGVPDIYQGTDLWDLSLVDPDNRRPVDFAERQRVLDAVQLPAASRTLLENWHDGAIKLHIIHTVLALRAADPDLFAEGDYEPLLATGPQADCLCAFARRQEDRCVIVLTSRFPSRLDREGISRETSIALPAGICAGRLRNLFTGGALPICDGAIDIVAALADLPVAVFG